MTGWNIDLPTTQYLGPLASADELQALINEVDSQAVVAIDTETTGLVVWRDLPLYWSMAWGNRRVTVHANLLPQFLRVFANPNITWVLANAKYDMHILANVGIILAGKTVDVQVMHALLYEDKPHALKFIVNHICGWTYADFETTFGKIGKKQSAEDVIKRAERENMSLLIEYAANDAWGTLVVFRALQKQLEEAFTHSLFCDKPPYINTLSDLFWKVEVPYTKTLWRMERHGIKVDRSRLVNAKPEAERELGRLEKEIYKLRGRAINPKSPQQLREWLIEELKLKAVSFTKGGKTGARSPSVDKKFMDYHAGHPAVQLLQEHRDYTKLYGTYIVGLHELLDPKDRIHSRFNQDVARTGRLSSSNPNLQNIPRPENDKWNLRSAFIPEDGNVMVAVDYEQLEMRLLACAAMEPKMIAIFASGKDIHTGNVEMVFGIPYDDVVKAKAIEKKVKHGELPPEAMTVYVEECLRRRNEIKAIGFGLNYGMGAITLAARLGISKEEATSLINGYMGTYPAVQEFFYEAVAETKATGFAFTVLGRRRNIQEIFSYRKGERSQGERLATNTQIQGSAADVCKMAQVNIHKAMIEERLGAKMLLQVHDELVFECPKEQVDDVLAEVVDLMEHPFYHDLEVHMAVDGGQGDSWGVAK